MGKSLGELFTEICMMITMSAAKKGSDEQVVDAYRKLKNEGGDKKVIGAVREEMRKRKL